MKRIPLRKARTAKKLTQKALAARLGKEQAFISKLETGRVPEPSFSDGLALARELDVDPTRLSFGHAEATR